MMNLTKKMVGNHKLLLEKLQKKMKIIVDISHEFEQNICRVSTFCKLICRQYQ